MRIERRILLGRMETGTGGRDDPANKAYWRRQMGRRAMSDVRPASHSRRVASEGCYRGARQGGRWGGATYILYLWNLIYRSTPCSAWPMAVGSCAPRWATRCGRRLMSSLWWARKQVPPRAQRAPPALWPVRRCLWLGTGCNPLNDPEQAYATQATQPVTPRTWREMSWPERWRWLRTIR